MWWGFSPALDILSELEKYGYKKIKNGSDELNVLLIGAADGRHVLKTLAQYYRHKTKTKINFYIMEANMDLVARQIMFFTIALEPPHELGLFEKMMIFMELYGNSLVRPTTANYLSRKSAQFVHMVTDLDYQVKRIPLFRLDQLKYRERDYLENVFKFWQEPVSRFPILQFWDNRLRKHLGTRYDSRKGVFDWDFHMHLRPRGAKYISSYEYKTWRSSGVAFVWLETESTEPNLTLATGAVQIGDKLCHHGYLGDITIGPFLAYSLDCEDNEMLKSLNGEQLKRTTEIVERNVSRMLYELLHQEPYVSQNGPRNDCRSGVIITEVPDVEKFLADKVDNDSSNKQRKVHKKETYSAIPVDFAEATFLSQSAITEFPQKQKYKKMFDVIFISENMTKHINKDLIEMACDGGIIIVETELFHLGKKKEDIEAAYENIKSKLSEGSCKIAGEFDVSKDSYITYIINKE
ncbi:hypothetical protein L9F63_012436 [Diploptera punctata]|uniref:Dynein assembly factor 3, axonemal n=1 Tax=Diploptera punctata TaxID=6984 RepID=A0AAD8ADV2_DIPPU|nr:hypothetical protein L9F63_012436 [Diploptera punctata]